METRKVVGQVTLEECAEIQTLFERKNGLKELANITTSDNNDLYEKLVKDMGKTSANFQQWWDQKSKQYGWEGHPRGNWEINFDTREIYLVIKDA